MPVWWDVRKLMPIMLTGWGLLVERGAADAHDARWPEAIGDRWGDVHDAHSQGLVVEWGS